MKKTKKFTKKIIQEDTSNKFHFFQNGLELNEKILDIPLIYFFTTLIITFLLSAVILLLTYFNILDAFKPWFLSHFDVLNFTRYPKGSIDIGIVFASLVSVAGLAIIHPIFGICGISLIRCWLDGYTYPTDNTYFVWAIILVSLSYIIRTFLLREKIRLDIHTITLLSFIFILILLLPVSWQIGKTYRHLILWASYALLFLSAYGSIKTTSQKNILTWVILLTLGLQTWYAFYHFQYVLPFLRKSLLMDPSLRIKFFGTAELSKELIYRFNINRAFGTMLFPNALGGFIILLLPIVIYWSFYYIYMLYNEWQISNKEPIKKKEERSVLIQTAIIWFLSTIIIYATELFPLTYTFEENSNIDVYLTAGFASLMSLIPSGLFAWICLKKGHQAGKYFIFSIIFSLCSFFSLLSLWLTYSRGSWLSLFLSIFLLFMLFIYFRYFDTQRKRIFQSIIFLFIAGFCLLSVSLLASMAFAENTQQDTTNKETFSNEKNTYNNLGNENKAAEEIMESGVGVSWEHLSDPSSFRLRWSYWKVGLIMWFHNFFTGVGLGNFALAYPHYQYIGAGDVKECHNGYLQILCETGILGGFFFLFFILTILYKIARCVKENRNYYAIVWSIGILAFLIHAGLDIHFSHPSLVTYFIIGLAVFLNETQTEKMNVDSPLPQKINSLPVSIITSLACCILLIASTFPYARDLVRSRMSFLNVGKDTEIPLVLKSINYVFTDVLNFALNKTDKQPKMSATILKYFFVDLNKLRMFGNLYVPEGPGSNKAKLLPEGNPVPDNAVLLVKEPWLLINRIRNSSVHYADYLKQVDNIFPYQEDIPNYLSEINKLLFLYSSPETDLEIVNNSRKEMLYWANEAIRRSPHNGDLYYNYGKALWFAGAKDCNNPDEQNSYIKLAIDNFEKSASIWKNVPFYWDEYIAHMKDAIGFFEKNNSPDEIEIIRKKIDEASQYVSELKEKRAQLNIW